MQTTTEPGTETECIFDKINFVDKENRKYNAMALCSSGNHSTFRTWLLLLVHLDAFCKLFHSSPSRQHGCCSPLYIWRLATETLLEMPRCMKKGAIITTGCSGQRGWTVMMLRAAC